MELRGGEVCRSEQGVDGNVQTRVNLGEQQAMEAGLGLSNTRRWVPGVLDPAGQKASGDWVSDPSDSHNVLPCDGLSSAGLPQ